MALQGIWPLKLCAVNSTLFSYYLFNKGQNHGVAVDYYALGIIVYECMVYKQTKNYFRLEKGLIWGRVVKKLENKFWQNKSN